MDADTPHLTNALAAMRAARIRIGQVTDAWEAPYDTGVRVCVSVASGELQRGDAYDTWVVTLGADGEVTSFEKFSSLACSPRGTPGRSSES